MFQLVVLPAQRKAAECGAASYIPKAVFGPDRLEEAWEAAKPEGASPG